MDYGHLCEALMLVCFGFSWPLNVRKAYKARTTKGTSLAFIILIITGYIAGITAKYLNHQINYVLAVYFINLAIVSCNVVVYFRNLALDKRRKDNPNTKKVGGNMNYQNLNAMAEENAVILFGGSLDQAIPVSELAQSFGFNFKIYNRSSNNISIKDAKTAFDKGIKPIKPEGILIHLGDTDLTMFKNNPSDFDNYYLDLIADIKVTNPKCRIALVSVYNKSANQQISEMNRHIKAISLSEKCDYINIDNAKLWNPATTQAALTFAHNMGLNVRKPLCDVAEILYSYAYTTILSEEIADNLAG